MEDGTIFLLVMGGCWAAVCLIMGFVCWYLEKGKKKNDK